MPEFSLLEVIITAIVVAVILATFLLSDLLELYSDHRERRAPYDGFKGHSSPMRIFMIFVGILAFVGAVFMIFVGIFST